MKPMPAPQPSVILLKSNHAVQTATVPIVQTAAAAPKKPAPLPTPAPSPVQHQEPAPPTGKMSTAQVKQLVEKYCGNNARDLAVRYLADGTLEVQLHVASQAVSDAMFDRIVTIPELGPYQMKVSVTTQGR
jgi:hypothetical protein